MFSFRTVTTNRLVAFAAGVHAILGVFIVHHLVQLCFRPSDASGVTSCSKVKNSNLLTLKIARSEEDDCCYSNQVATFVAQNSLQSLWPLLAGIDRNYIFFCVLSNT